MKSDVIEFGKRKVGIIRHQLSVFLICLGLSLFLWFLVRLSKDYNITMKYNIEYRGIPSGLKLTGFSDSTLDINLRIQGFEYFSEQYFKREKRNLEISLRNVKIRQTEDNIKGYILTKNLYRTIAEQTNYSSEIFSLSPDTLFFFFERKFTLRKIPASSTRTIEIKPAKDSVKNRHDSILLIKTKDLHRSGKK